MRQNKKRWSVSIAFFIAIGLAMMVLTSVPDVSGQIEKVLNNRGLKTTMTGRIDRIGSNDITINDTWYKFYNDVSVVGFKVGDHVSFIATDKYEILKIVRADEKVYQKE